MFRITLCQLCMWTTSAVNRPPNIILQPLYRDIYFKSGQSVEILCEADGIPKPTYIWKRNGQDFNTNGLDDRVVQLPDTGTIVFNSTEDKDEGTFQCFADNGYGISVSDKINLREAKLRNFSYEPRTTHRVAAGKQFTLPCSPPINIPVPGVPWVAWILKEPDGRWQVVNTDKRVSVDLEGHLRFANVKKSDEQDGKAYACIAFNYFMDDEVIGPEHLIEIIDSVEQKHPAVEMWTSPSDQFFLAGGTLRLKCIFSGNPTPDVSWKKLNGILPHRARFEKAGLELVITRVDKTDAGQFECSGLNNVSTQRAAKGFDIRIESFPNWFVKPKTVEAYIGDKATFICKANGDPQPEYSWYINGVSLEDIRDPRIYNNARFFKPDANNITLTNLTLEDHMNIQCNVSNKHGYKFADVYLNVLVKKPTIIKQPSSFVNVNESESLTIDCLVTGKPDPNISWYRNQSQVTDGRFQILSNGSLHIQNVVMADAGDYHCQAKNIYGNDISTTCIVEIEKNIRTEQCSPDDAMFFCSGSTHFSEAVKNVILWNFLSILVSYFAF